MNVLGNDDVRIETKQCQRKRRCNLPEEENKRNCEDYEDGGDDTMTEEERKRNEVKVKKGFKIG